MEIRTQLLPPEDGNLPVGDGEISEDVDREVQPQSWRITTDRGRTNRYADKSLVALLLEHLFAHCLVLRIVGQRLQRQLFGYIGIILDTVNGRGRRIDEASNTGRLACFDQGTEAIVVDRPSELGIEVE